MKIRQGFVSNSSSSSYLLIVPEEVHNSIMKDQSAYYCAAINTVANAQEVLGRQAVVISWMSGNYGTFDYQSVGIEPSPDDLDGPYDVLDDYQVRACKNPEVFYNYESF